MIVVINCMWNRSVISLVIFRATYYSWVWFCWFFYTIFIKFCNIRILITLLIFLYIKKRFIILLLLLSCCVYLLSNIPIIILKFSLVIRNQRSYLSTGLIGLLNLNRILNLLLRIFKSIFLLVLIVIFFFDIFQKRQIQNLISSGSFFRIILKNFRD